MSPVSRPRSLRWHLLVLTFGTLLPLVLFGVAATALVTVRERSAFERAARERNRALLTAVDAELSGHVASLDLLGHSSELEAGRMPSFREEVLRAIRSQSFWRSVLLARPDGELLFDTSRLEVAELGDVSELASFRQAARTGKPVVGDLHEMAGSQRFTVSVPVLLGGDLRYVLSASIDPKCILALLKEQEVPPDWVIVVLDREERIVARTLSNDKFFGSYASPSLRGQLAERSQGWFHGSTLEGTDVYTPFSRSEASQWSVAFGIPARYVQAGAHRALGIFGIGVLVAVGFAFGLATALGRRISQPIGELADLAEAVGSGAPLEQPPVGEVLEVNAVSKALVTSSAAVREREVALRDADRAKDEFLAMLGHELRNPLSAISAAAQVLQVCASEQGPAQESAAIVGRQVRHMTRLVDDLLDVSRVTTGKIALSLRPLDLAEVVRNALDAMRRAERTNEHRVELDAREAWVEADEPRIEQIVSNLVGNALKYTPKGGRIRVRVRREGAEARFEVEDEGVGMSPELLERVFDLFVQGERSLDRRAGGLGIGLTLVRRLAELHGGSASAASEGAGRGSRFTVRLPAIEPRPVRRPTAVSEGAIGGACRRVLLVEDNADARVTLRAALELAGFEMHEAADGREGLEAARALHPDVAVIDIGLPGMDGYELARALRSEGSTDEPLLIALTGYGQNEARRRALEAGFDIYLTKPVAPDHLARLVEDELAERRAGAGETEPASG